MDSILADANTSSAVSELALRGDGVCFGMRGDGLAEGLGMTIEVPGKRKLRMGRAWIRDPGLFSGRAYSINLVRMCLKILKKS